MDLVFRKRKERCGRKLLRGYKLKYMKNIISTLILSLFTFSFCCEMEEVTREVGDYKDGEKHGKWISYCKHENKIQEGNYKNGKKHGKWISYFEDGQVWFEGNYNNGKEHGEFIYFGNGNYNIIHKLELVNYKDGELDGQSIHYHVNGEINSIVNYQNGEKDGKNIFFDKDGKIYWSGNYKDGVLVDGDFIKSDKPFNLY